jgi:hypothetical protein
MRTQSNAKKSMNQSDRDLDDALDYDIQREWLRDSDRAFQDMEDMCTDRPASQPITDHAAVTHFILTRLIAKTARGATD